MRLFGKNDTDRLHHLILYLMSIQYNAKLILPYLDEDIGRFWVLSEDQSYSPHKAKDESYHPYTTKNIFLKALCSEYDSEKYQQDEIKLNRIILGAGVIATNSHPYEHIKRAIKNLKKMKFNNID